MQIPPISTLFPYTTLFRSPLLRRNTDAGVANMQGDVILAIDAVHQRRLDRDLAARRELDRVAHEVGEDLLRSEEHTSELQSRLQLVCRLLLEKKKLHPTNA